MARGTLIKQMAAEKLDENNDLVKVKHSRCVHLHIKWYTFSSILSYL